MVLLTDAKDHLFTRPPEEHYVSFGGLRADAFDQRRRCREIDAKDTSIRIADDGKSVHCGDAALGLTPYGLGQLASMARVPMALLERLDGQTRANVLNQTLPRNRRYKVALADRNRLRCITSDRYERVWDADVLAEVDRWLLPSGFVPAMPTINTDERGTNLRGNTKPALFRSDRDMFCFFYSDQEPGDDGLGGLRKGVMVFNSEVGAKSFGFSTFYFREMCANFLIWDASGIRSRSARHTGAVKAVVREFREDLMRIGSTITTAELDVFRRASDTRFVPAGPNEESEAVRRLTQQFKFSQADAREVVHLVRSPENPGDLSVWGVINGITSAAEAMPHADGRARVSGLAGRVLGAAIR